MDILIIYLVILIVLFLIFRAVVLWYFRINEMADTLLEINRTMALIALKINKQETNITRASTDSNESSSLAKEEQT